MQVTSPSVKDLRKRAKELGVSIPSNVEKTELIELLEQAERGVKTRSVSELKARLQELGLQVPKIIVEKAELLQLVLEAERQQEKEQEKRERKEKQIPTSPPPKVRFRNSAGDIPRPWYQMESRTKPGHFYFINADTGERTWVLPQAPASQSPPPAKRYGTSGPASSTKGFHATAVPPGMPPLPPASGGTFGAPCFVQDNQSRLLSPAAGRAAASTAAAFYGSPTRPSLSPADAAVTVTTHEIPSIHASGIAADSTDFDSTVKCPEQAISSDPTVDFGVTQRPTEEMVEEMVGATIPALAAVQTIEESGDEETDDEGSRNDYRDHAFSEAAPPLAPVRDRRWSREGAMTCNRNGADIGTSGTVKSLCLEVPADDDQWDPDTTIAPELHAVHGSKFTWVRGKMIGRGSLGRVFKALDTKTGMILAVKEVPIDLRNEGDRKYVEDLQNEVSIMQELNNPHIVRYLGHDFMDNSLYMYLEHMPGGSLTQALQQFGAFDESLLGEYAKQILCGLEYMHTRDPAVVHRDIKGPNILVGADCKVKLADFGCAKRTQETMTHTLRGSIHWMAPEVIAHERYGRAADIWSFGCVCIEMGTATVPWGKLDNQMAAVIKIGMSDETPPLPEGLSLVGEDFISQCLHRDATLRPTASDLLQHELIRQITFPD